MGNFKGASRTRTGSSISGCKRGIARKKTHFLTIGSSSAVFDTGQRGEAQRGEWDFRAAVRVPIGGGGKVEPSRTFSLKKAMPEKRLYLRYGVEGGGRCDSGGGGRGRERGKGRIRGRRERVFSLTPSAQFLSSCPSSSEAPLVALSWLWEEGGKVGGLCNMGRKTITRGASFFESEVGVLFNRRASLL